MTSPIVFMSDFTSDCAGPFSSLVVVIVTVTVTVIDSRLAFQKSDGVVSAVYSRTIS